MKTHTMFVACVAMALTFVCAPNVNARSAFWSSPPDGSQACASCHGSTTTCAGCHAHGVHPDSSKNSVNVTATTDKATYTAGETVTVSVSGSYRSGWVRAKLWDQDCSVIGCLSMGAVAVATNTCPSCPVGVGGVDGVTSEFPGPVILTFPAPDISGVATWSASWYGNDFDLGRIGGSTTFGPLWLMDSGNANHGDEIVTFSFRVQGGNREPVAVDDLAAGVPIASTLANTPVDIDVLANDTDADGDTITINSFDIASSSGGSVSCSLSATTPTPQCNFTPAIDSCGTDSFSYDVTDGIDASLNRATVTIQVGDTNGPIVSAPTDVTITVPEGTTSVPATNLDIVAFLAAATATDPEDGIVAVSNNAPANFPVGTTPVTFTANDICGNPGAATANVIILIAGNNTPVVTAPAPLAITAQLCATSLPQSDTEITAWLAMATADDTEDGPLPVSHNAPLDFLIGDTLVTFSATDSINTTGSADSILTIIETPNSAPTINAPAPLTVTVAVGTSSVPATDPEIAAFLAAASANDVQDGALSVSNNAPVDFPLGVTTVSFTATDVCGLTTTVEVTVTILESDASNTPPSMTLPTRITVIGPMCATSVPATDPAIEAFLNGATATDAEDGDLTALITHNAPTDFPASISPGIVTRVTFSVTDSGDPSGFPFTAQGSSKVTVIDPNTAPTVNAPAPLTLTVAMGTTLVPASDPAIAAFLASGNASDSQDGALSVSNGAPENFPIGTTTVSFSATDSCGLITTITSTLTIVEEVGGNNAPLVLAPADLAVTAPLCATSVAQSDSAISNWLALATASDIEDGTLAVSHNAPLDFLLGDTLVTFSATDSLNATGLASSTLALNPMPNSAPTVNAPAAISLTVPQGTTSLPASDAAIATFLAAASANDAEDGALSVSNDAPANFPLGVTTVTFTATDGCGLTTTTTSTVTIQEEVINIAPLAADDTAATPLNTPLDIDVLANDTDADGDTLTVNSFDAVSSNGGNVSCSLSATTPSPQCSFTPASNVCGSDSFSYDVTDGMDTSNRAIVTIQVGDANAPVVTAPTNLTITLPAGSSGPVPVTDAQIANWLALATATDTEDGSVPVSNNALASFSVGTTPVTFTAVDGCGNSASALANVIIIVADNNDPVVTAPAVLSVTASLCATSVPQSDDAITNWLAMATASDIEDGDLSVSNNAPLNFLLGDTLVTFSATDSLGASGSASSTLNVNETPNTAPTVNAPTAIDITVAAGTTSVPATDPAIAAFLASASASDTQDGALSVSNNAPANFPVGVTTVTFSATDACGLSSSATSTVSIQEQPAEIVDLDITQFRTSKSVRLSRVKPVDITLTVQNNGAVEGSAPATVVGVQNGTEVYNQTMTVTDGLGNGRSSFDFPSYSPTTAGEIVWTVTIVDNAPDNDQATAITAVQ